MVKPSFTHKCCFLHLNKIRVPRSLFLANSDPFPARLPLGVYVPCEAGRPPLRILCLGLLSQVLETASDLLLRVCSRMNGRRGWLPLQPAVLHPPNQNLRVWASRWSRLLRSRHSPPKCWHRPDSCTGSETAEIQPLILTDLPGKQRNSSRPSFSRCGSRLSPFGAAAAAVGHVFQQGILGDPPRLG